AEPEVARGVDAIPATLADSLMARLDRLSAAKEVAQRAAMVGREFPYVLLAAVAEIDEARVRQGLARPLRAPIPLLPPPPPAARRVHLQARARAGGGVRVAPQAHAPAAPRAGRRRAAGAVRRAGRERARAGGAACRGGGADRRRDHVLRPGRRAGTGALGAR